MRYLENDLAGKRILITGGGGFIGSNLALYFQEHHPKAIVKVFDCFRTGEQWPSGNPTSFGHESNLTLFKGEIIRGNITVRNDLHQMKDFAPDIIYHQAAISDTTVDDEGMMFKTNVDAYEQILSIALALNATMIYASSAGTYGNSTPPNRVGYNESPTNLYGLSKLKMDQLTLQYLDKNPLAKVVGLRYFNVFGENEYKKGKTASMILQLGLQALQNKKVRLFKYGEQQRDFIYVQDVIQANVKAIEAAKSGIYNVGSGVSRSFNDIIQILKSELGEFEVEYFDNPYSFYQNHTQADITDTIRHLGYNPIFSLEKGIHSYMKEIRDIYSRQ